MMRTVQNNAGMIPCGFHAYSQLFMATQPKLRCFVPELDADPGRNLTDQFIRNLTYVYCCCCCFVLFIHALYIISLVIFEPSL